jgi:hypothetical protein
MGSCRLCLSLLFALPASAQEPSPAPDDRRITALEARVAHQDEQIARLNETVARQQEQLVHQSEQIAHQNERPNLFRLGGLAVSLSGFVQADAVAYDQSSVDELSYSTGAPLNNTRFLIRRARLRIEGDYKYAGGVLEFDGNTTSGPVARITNAEVYGRLPSSHTVPYVMLSVGLTRIPFGFEVQELDWKRLFLERSNLARALFPGEYDLGVKVSGGWRWLRYQLAAMNGNPSGDKQFALRDPNQSKDIVGRLGVETAIGARVTLAAGISALWGTGFHQGSPSTKDMLIWRDLNGDGQVDPTELSGVLGMAGLPSQNFERWAAGGDLRLLVRLPRVGELALYGEITWASNLDRALYVADPVEAGRDLRELGWYLAVTQQLTKWAAIGLRYDRYDPDADRTQKIAASIVPRDLTLSTLSLTAAFMYAPYLRITFEWDHNQNALANLPSGAPATLGADQVTFRAQVLF